jgi:Zn-dependent peptidase ImmA (M78 family)
MSIQRSIAALYQEIGLTPPSPRRCITPLGEIIDSYQLTSTELTGLTGGGAVEYLMQRGVMIHQPARLGEDALAGFLYVSPNFGSIFVERRDMIMRRRFSAAHELGHYLLHFRPLLQSLSPGDAMIEVTDALPISEDVEPDLLPMSSISMNEENDPARLLPPLERMEMEANQFAAELLMPEDVAHELAEERAKDFRGDDLVLRLATEMLVSQAAMRWRLIQLGLIEREQRSN